MKHVLWLHKLRDQLKVSAFKSYYSSKLHARLVWISFSCPILLQHFQKSKYISISMNNGCQHLVCLSGAHKESLHNKSSIGHEQSIHSSCSFHTKVNAFPCQSIPSNTWALSSLFNKQIPMNKKQLLVFKSYKTLCSKPNSLLWTYEGLAARHSSTHCFAHCPVVSTPPDHPHLQRPCIKATVEWGGNWWGCKRSWNIAGITF